MRNNQIGRRRGRFYSCPGDPLHAVRSPRVQADGTIRLEVTGYENTDEIIHAQRASTELSAILARYANGDLSALNRYQAIYADVSIAPKSLAEAMQHLIDAEMAFNALPVDIKKQFNSDWRQWLSSSGTEEWFTAMKPVISPVADNQSSEAADGVPAGE